MFIRLWVTAVGLGNQGYELQALGVAVVVCIWGRRLWVLHFKVAWLLDRTVWESGLSTRTHCKG